MLQRAVRYVYRRMLPRSYMSRDFRRRFGRALDLANPRTFTEKVNLYKLRRDRRMAELADKVLAKDFIARTLGPDFVVPTLWHGTELPPRAERNWPTPFVLKANHGSGWNIYVRSEEERDWDKIEPLCRRWLKATYGASTQERFYSRIKPQLLVEPFLGGAGDFPDDYRVHVFGGRAVFVRVSQQVGDTRQDAYYDLDWKPMQVQLRALDRLGDCPRPKQLSRMIEAAEQVAAGFPFVRVDFYEIGGCLYLGEMTFAPSGGHLEVEPPEFDLKLGTLWPD